MRAGVLIQPSAPIQIDEVEIASPVGHEVLVRTAATGLCHSDLLFATGAWPHPVPTILGHEVAGVVEAIGPDVVRISVGDHVVGCSGAPCYSCRYCETGRPTICPNRQPGRSADEPPRLSLRGQPVHQFAQLSGFAEYMLVHENAAVKIPSEIAMHLAAIIPCAVATGLGSVLNTAAVEAGASVVIVGCGGVGLSAVQGARIAGAAPIIAVDIVARKLDLARELGADHTVNASEVDAITAVKELTGGGGDYVIESSGAPAACEQTFLMCGTGGTIVLVGAPPQGTRVSFDPTLFIPTEKTLKGCRYGGLRPRTDIPRYCDMYLRGQLDLETLVTTKIGLDEINEGFTAMQGGDVARSVITFE
jgi:S-(hydroxymethyl)glutathione dehydrogenase/alcohol dehydrogenase